MDVRTLIRKLGGPSKVAARVGVTPSAVTNWAARDAVSNSHLIAIWRLARETGVDWQPPGAEGFELQRSGHALEGCVL